MFFKRLFIIRPIRFSASTFLIVTLSLGLSACSIFGGDEVDLSAPAELQDFDATLSLKKNWTKKLGKGAEKIYPISIPVLQDDILYAADRSGSIYALESESGREIWSTKVDETVTGAVGVGGDQVLIGTQNGEVQAFDRESGAFLWKTQLSSEVVAAPGSNGEVVVAQALDGKVFGLSAADGSQRWLVDTNLPLLTVRGNAKPTVVDDVAYVGLDSGKAAAYRMEDGIVLWEVRVGLPEGRNDLERMVDIDGALLYHNGNVYAAAYQSGLMAINPQAGRGLWYQEGSSNNALGAYGGTLVVTQDNGIVKAFNSSDGTQLWETEEFKNRGLNAPALTNDFVAFADADGYLHLLTRRAGTLIGRVKVGGGGVRTPTIIGGDNIYILSNSGALTSYKVSEL